MLAAIVGTVMGRIVFNNLDIACQASTRIGAFNQVMAEKGIARKAPVQHAVHSINFIDSLSGENSLVIEILINVGNRTRVDVKPCLARVQAGQP